jgi:type IV pilus assembly protein PilE
MNKRHAAGFTLIELMIVVVVMGILAAIAYPSYTRYITESRRSDAQIGLTQLANMEEKFFSQCNKYTIATTTGTVQGCDGLGMTSTGTPGQTYSPNRYYILTVAAPAGGSIDTAFIATATPVAGTTQANDGKFTLAHTGLKQWDKNNDGSYAASEATWKKN